MPVRPGEWVTFVAGQVPRCPGAGDGCGCAVVRGKVQPGYLVHVRVVVEDRRQGDRTSSGDRRGSPITHDCERCKQRLEIRPELANGAAA